MESIGLAVRVISLDGHGIGPVVIHAVCGEGETLNGIPSHHERNAACVGVERDLHINVSRDLTVRIHSDTTRYWACDMYDPSGSQLPIETDDTRDAMIQAAMSAAWPTEYIELCRRESIPPMDDGSLTLLLDSGGGPVG